MSCTDLWNLGLHRTCTPDRITPNGIFVWQRDNLAVRWLEVRHQVYYHAIYMLNGPYTRYRTSRYLIVSLCKPGMFPLGEIVSMQSHLG